MIAALLLGLLSSLHCIGMCGPIALMLPVHRDKAALKTLKIIAYHLGRIFTYSLLGGLFALLGKGLFIAGLQQNFSIVIGVLMIIYGTFSYQKLENIAFLKPLQKIQSKVKTTLAQQFRKNGIMHLFLIGVANGFLPCAMVYVALFGATATQEPSYGMLYMALFGLGTIPLMSGVTYFSQAITLATRNKILKIIPFFLLLLGVLFVLRGLGLTLPFVSPGTMQLFVTAHPSCMQL